jgi:hypothetical protein
MIQPPLLIFRDVPFGPDMKIEVWGAIQTVQVRAELKIWSSWVSCLGDRQQRRAALVRARGNPD